MAGFKRYFTGASASAKRTGATAKCSYYRQSKRQNDGKRGPRGVDAYKQLCGRKRHIAVDTQGLLLRAIVHPANLQDKQGIYLVLTRLSPDFSRLRLVWVDNGYHSFALRDWVATCLQAHLVWVKRQLPFAGGRSMPRRWVVERTFAWFGRGRRLSKDYEQLPRVSEALLYIAMSALMLTRLARYP
jgi:putative transposase